MKQIEGVAFECQFKEYRFVFQIIELGAGNARSSVKIDEVELLAKLYVVFGFEVENSRGTNSLHFEVIFVFLATWSIRVCHIGNPHCSFVEPLFDVLQRRFQRGDALFKRFAFLDNSSALFRRQLALHGRGVFIAFFALFFQSLECSRALIVKSDHKIRICDHITVSDILFDGGKVFFDKSVIQHDFVMISMPISSHKRLLPKTQGKLAGQLKQITPSVYH